MVKKILTLVALATVLIVLLALRITPWFPTDDAYISFRYAQNWVAGHGLVFNPGERVEGYSNFLYVVLLAGAQYLGVTPPLASRLINTVSVITILALLLFALPGRLRLSKARYLVALTFVLSAHTIVNVLSGLEAPFFAALILAGVLAIEHRRRTAPILFLAVSLTRPEGIALAAVAGMVDFCRALLERDRQEAQRVIGRWAICAVLPYLGFLLWRMVYYSQLLPNSVYAKLGFSLAEKLHYSSMYLRGVIYFWPLLLLPLAGWLAHWLRRSSAELWSALFLFLSLASIATYAGAGDPYRVFFRYPYPAVPLLLVLAVLGAERLLAAALGPFSRIAVTTSVFGLLAFGVAWAARPLSGTYQSSLPPVERLSTGLKMFFQQDTQPHDANVRGLALGLHGLAGWLAEHARSDELASMAEVGIAPYYSGVRVVDTSGLITKHIAHLPGRHGTKADNDYVFGLEPDYFVFKKRADCMCSGAPADVKLFRDKRLRHGYDLVRLFPEGHRSILLFKKRSSLPDTGLDLCSGSAPEVAHGLFTGRSRVNVFDDIRRQEILERFKLVIRDEIIDFEAVDLMREWLSQWRCYNMQLPVANRDDGAVRHRVTVPDRPILSFAVGIPPDPRNLPQATDIVFEIEIESEGETTTVFRQVLRPRKINVWQEHQIELNQYAGRGVSIDLRVYQESDESQRTVFNAGWAEMLLFSED